MVSIYSFKMKWRTGNTKIFKRQFYEQYFMLTFVIRPNKFLESIICKFVSRESLNLWPIKEI